MHTVPVLSESLPSVALCLPGATNLVQSKIIRNMFVNTVLRQLSSIIQVEIRR